jgi:eukaryotic-like serine/threonine-protein kinase
VAVSPPDARFDTGGTVSGTKRWDHVKALFQQALERAPAERATFLRDACGGDDALRTEVESQLVAHEQMGAFVEGSPLEALSDSAVASFARVLKNGARLGAYEIVAPIGVGGMGEVYRAHDTKLGRDVALKILPQTFAHDPERVARFRREARVLAALNHPHIAAIYGIEDSGATQFLVLELVEGETLSERLKRGALPLEKALWISWQIADALQAAHDKNIIHRDLKPANIALTVDDRVKLLDFGLARMLQQLPIDLN